MRYLMVLSTLWLLTPSQAAFAFGSMPHVPGDWPENGTFCGLFRLRPQSSPVHEGD
ncbi:hypothetical protein [Halovulum sp. GXIMD14793]